VTLIYLRHGDDRGNDIYRHDHRLNKHGRAQAPKAAKRLIEKYGHPNTVLCSPFRRTLETLTAMSERFTRPVIVHSDSRLAQGLSEERQRDPQVSPETLAQIMLVEDKAAFQLRIAKHVSEVRRMSGVIWCVTHQAVIEEVAIHFNVKIPERIDFLDHVVMVG
jgi:broad specificity phosphatase PhoE